MAKKRPSSERRSGSALLRWDIFGEQIGMTIAGESTFNTCSGMLMTLLVLALTLMFAVLGAF